MTLNFSTFKIKSYDDDTGIVEGYASRFDIKDQVNDIVEKGAFAQTIQNKQNVRFLWQHDRKEPIGIIEDLKEDDKGLYIKARFANTQRAQETRELMKMGALDSFSIGYRVPKGKTVIEHTKDGQVQRLKEVQLHEVSVVTFPCNVEARLTGIKSSLEGRFADLTLDQQKAVSDYMDFLIAKSAGAVEAAADEDDAVESASDTQEPQDSAEKASESVSEAVEDEGAKAAALEMSNALDRLLGALNVK